MKVTFSRTETTTQVDKLDEQIPTAQCRLRSKSSAHPGFRPITLRELEPASLHCNSAALKVLHEDYRHAEHLGMDNWEFAEEIENLWQLGLTNGDLRWLIFCDFVEHGREITEIGLNDRIFQRENGFCFGEQSCFVLTEKGASYIGDYLNHPPQIEVIHYSHPPIDMATFLQPEWDPDRHELRVGNALVKRFKVPARNQETILNVFQEEDWHVYIDDPLPQHPEIESKRRLHDTINSLNRSQKNPLIKFRGNGSGEGIRWEHFQQSDTEDSAPTTIK